MGACLVLGAGSTVAANASLGSMLDWHVVAALLDSGAAAAPAVQGTLLALALAQRLAGLELPRMAIVTHGALTSAAAHGGAWGLAR
eukprot:4707222-Prymnesium_polylepis.1